MQDVSRMLNRGPYTGKVTGLVMTITYLAHDPEHLSLSHCLRSIEVASTHDRRGRAGELLTQLVNSFTPYQEYGQNTAYQQTA